MSIVEYVFGFWAVILATVDFALAKRRDWLHWTGIATHLSNRLVNLIWTIGSLMMDA